MENVIVNPNNPNEVYKVGTKGRRPKWLTEMLLVNPSLLPEKEVKVKEFVAVSNATRYFKWCDQDGKPTTPCIVGAKTEQDAVLALNRTFKLPVFDSEWKLCWKEVDPATIELAGAEGVFILNGTTWEARKVINK